MRRATALLVVLAGASCGGDGATDADKAFCRELRVQIQVARAGGSGTDGTTRLRILADRVDDDNLADHAAELMAFGSVSVAKQTDATRQRLADALADVGRDCKRLGAPLVDD